MRALSLLVLASAPAWAGLGAARPPTRLEALRDATVAELRTAGVPAALRSLGAPADEGLILWRVMRRTTRGGQDVVDLHLSLPAEPGRPLDLEPDPVRSAELKRRLDKHGPAVRELVAKALSTAEKAFAAENVSLDGRLIETCCGAGCGPCLHALPGAADFTGLPRRPPRGE